MSKRKPAAPPVVPEKPKRRSPPAAVPLPGLEGTRNVRLDRYCETLGDIRTQLSTLRQDEQDQASGALREMHNSDRETYQHAGVELVRLVGTEKLRVRATRDAANTSGPSPADVDFDTRYPEPPGE